ncbi:MAG: hypothetical protein NTY74_11010 [Ignavibacteriae bacterium]|nr:hypothetical protein [Ignavibacteriota bacterium]
MEEYTKIEDILKYKNLKEPFKYLIILGLIFTLPQNMIVFMVVCLILIVMTIDKPILVLYIATAIISYRYYFVDTTNIENSLFFVNFWKRMPISATFVANSHNFIFVYLFLAILKQIPKTLRVPKEFNRLIVLSLFILILIVTSGLLNSSGYYKMLLFIMQFFRPLLFFLLIIIINWEEGELKKYFGFVLLIIFPMQIVLTFIDFWQLVVQGELLLGDLFTGSFCFPFNNLTVQIMFYALFIVFSEFIITRSKKYLWFVMVLVYGILSAQSGLQTAVILFFSIPFALWLILNPETLGLKRLQTNFIFGLSFVIISMFLLVLFVSPELKGYDGVITYNVSMTEQVFGEIGILETPKIRTFEILFDNILNGSMNPFLGLGPGGYLSGASMVDNKSYMEQILSNPLYFTQKYTGNMLAYPTNNFVGITGEIGIIGYILFFSIYLIPYKYVLRNRYIYYNTFWHSTFIGFVGLSFALFGWSLFWNAIEDFAIPVYFWIIGGILYVVSNNDLNFKGKDNNE